MCAGLTIAISSPACTAVVQHDCCSAPGGRPASRPKETLLTPSEVSTPGRSALIRRMPSMRLDGRVGELRVAGGQGEGQRIEDQRLRAQAVLVDGDIVDAPGDLQLALRRSWPCPSRRWSAPARRRCASWPGQKTWSALARPASRWVELIRQRPGAVFRAASITSGSVVSITSGTSTPIASFLTTLRISSASSGRSVTATEISRACAPPSTCSRASSRMAS